MQYGCDKLRADSSDAVEKVEISSDETWQRQGGTSLKRVVTVITIKDGKVLDS